MSFQNILVPVDADGYANDAIDEAISLAKLSGGNITAMHVSDKNDSPDIRKIIDGYVEKIRESGVRAEPSMMEGSPSDVILDRSKHYDIIVMGTSGKKKILVGSVARAVIKNASCPVIVVRSQR